MNLQDILSIGDIEKKTGQKYTKGVAPTLGVGTAWNAIGTTGKVLIGAGVGYGIASIFGQGKKQEAAATVSQQPSMKPTTIYNVGGDWQPSYDIKPTYQIDYSTIAGSPYASIATKKGSEAQGATPSYQMPTTYSQPTSGSAEASPTEGTDWLVVAAIAAVAIIGYGYVSKPKHGGKAS